MAAYGTSTAPSSGAATLPSTLVLADATTNTAPDLLVLQHTTSGTAAASFGETSAVELESAGGTTRRVLTDVTALQVATDAAEEARRTLSIMVAGALQVWGALGYRVAGNFPALFFGPASDDTTLGRVTGTLQLTVASTLAQQWTATGNTSNIQHTFSSRAVLKRGSSTAVATTITIPADGNLLPLTAGTGTLNSIVATGWQAGSTVWLECASGITITNNTSGTGSTILTSTGASIVTAFTRIIGISYNGTNWITHG